MDKRLSRGRIIASSFAAPLIALAGALLLTLAASRDPVQAVRAFFVLPWSSAWFVGNMLDQAVLLAVAGLGIAVAFQAGVFNLGGEGQMYLGGFIASLVLLELPAMAGWQALTLAAIAAIAVGAMMGGAAGFLKAVAGTDELISSFLLTGAVSPIIDYLISGPFRDGAGSLLALPRFAADRRLPTLLAPSRLNLSAIVAALLVAAVAFYLARSRGGYRLRIAGANPNFARFAGIEVRGLWTPAMAVSGALHGLAGFFAVAGTYGLCHRAFPGGLGWSALAVALIARNKPSLLLPAALLYAFMEAGSDTAHLSAGLPFETTAILQAIVFFLVSARLAIRWPLAGNRGRHLPSRPRPIRGKR